MGERKVMNKYFPPDFDPSLIPKRSRPKNEQIKVRIMIPFTLQCEKCGEYCYRGTKFNSRSEIVAGEDYLGLKIFRFYIKCPDCISEIIFRTDPKNSDYTLEHGASRNFEPWKQADDEIEARQKAQEEEEKGDSMAALENRTEQSKREIDILDALEEIKELNASRGKINEKISGVLDAMATQDNLAQVEQDRKDDSDDRRAMDAFQSKRSETINRLESDSASASESAGGTRKNNATSLFGNLNCLTGLPVEEKAEDGPGPLGALGMVVLKKKKKDKKEKKKKKKKDKEKSKKKEKNKSKKGVKRKAEGAAEATAS